VILWLVWISSATTADAEEAMKEVVKQILSAIAAFCIVVGIIYVAHELVVRIGGAATDTATDRGVILTLELFAVLILVSVVIGREATEMLANLLRVMKGEKLEGGSVMDKIGMVFATVVVSLGIFFCFVKYVVPL
jgi:hypothetical protein